MNTDVRVGTQFLVGLPRNVVLRCSTDGNLVIYDQTEDGTLPVDIVGPYVQDARRFRFVSRLGTIFVQCRDQKTKWRIWMEESATRIENPDKVPVAVPVGFEKPESLQDMVRRMVREQVAAAESVGDDEDVDDDGEELDLDDLPTLHEMADEIITALQEAKRNSPIAPVAPSAVKSEVQGPEESSS